MTHENEKLRETQMNVVSFLNLMVANEAKTLQLMTGINTNRRRVVNSHFNKEIIDM